MIINIGRAKTGTRSLDTALQRLGFKSMHDNSFFRGKDIVSAIIKAESLGYEAITESINWTCKDFQAVDDAFPDAKWILTTRINPEIWYRSFVKHHKKIEKSLNYDRSDETCPTKRQLWIRNYQTHILTSCEYFGSRQLIITAEDDSQKKWDMLCWHLGVDDVPREPFPHKNNSEDPKSNIHGNIQ